MEDYINVVLIGKGCEAYFKLMKDIKKNAGLLKKKIEISEMCNELQIQKLGVIQLPAVMINNKIILQGTEIEDDKIRKMLEGL